jgi:hypothetical protein
MKRLSAVFLALSLLAPAWAMDVAGVAVEPTVQVHGQTLHLNGAGIRKKFFVKVYVGSLYAGHRLRTAAEALRDPGDKLIRMNFLYGKVEAEKIREAFREGIAHNAPELLGTAELRQFLGLFRADLKRGDQLDLLLAADGTVGARLNGADLGSVASRRLAPGVLAIYLGDHPADQTLKEGLLGKGLHD